MTRWLTLQRDKLPLPIFTVGSLGLATIVAINIVNFYRVLMSDFLKVVGEGATAAMDGARKHKLSESKDDSLIEEIQMNGKINAATTVTSAATHNLVEKIRDVASLGKDFGDGTNNFHPLSRDMNKIMSSFFNNDVLEDSESISENEDSHEEAAPRKRKGACQTEAGSKATNEHIKDNGCLISPYSKKDD